MTWISQIIHRSVKKVGYSLFINKLALDLAKSVPPMRDLLHKKKCSSIMVVRDTVGVMADLLQIGCP